MATQEHSKDSSVYYVPHNGWYPVFAALGIFLSLVGVGHWLNMLKAGQPPSHADSVRRRDGPRASCCSSGSRR